jgi:hypothetical protein
MPEDIVFSQPNTSTPGSRGEPPRLEMLTLCQPNELRSALECLYVSFYRDPADLERYLAPTCLQHLGTLTLSYPQIVEHIKQIRASATKVRYSVVAAISQADTIADRHVVELTSGQGHKVTLEAFCFLRLAHGRIVEIWESVQTLEGDPTLAAVANAPA